MHAPDGFLSGPVAVVTGLVSLAICGLALRVVEREALQERVVLAGVVGAFIFAGQMFNFPVAAGTSGHLMGGTLAAILLGPWLGSLVVAVVVLVQALVFADGGITALGYNVLNMAVVPAFGGWGVFRLLRRFFPPNRSGVVASTALASGVGVVLSSVAFSLEWLFGATAPVAFDDVFAAMVGVHALIGIGEAVISGSAVGAVLAARPDLVYGATDLSPESVASCTPVGLRTFVLASLLVAVVFAAVVSQFASPDPDGLERVAADKGFIQSAREHPLADSPFADYATRGIDHERLSLATAGIAGVFLTLAVTGGVGLALRGIEGRRV